jgi:mannose-1-phosphate guanylyltransferase/mannose-6-phosphate isomerase
MVPVLLSGGVGSRLWPVSRELYPKQFLALGTGHHSMLQETCLRLNRLPVAAPVVVCNEAHRFLVAQQLADISLQAQSILLEPVGRNTAPALALAALSLRQAGCGDTVMLVLPADHLLEIGERFEAAITRAHALAEQGYLVTFGIHPDQPECGYGYIRQGEALGEGAFRVAAFVEKPDRPTAESYLQAGGYAWNSGMFMMRADRYLAELQQWAPAILACCEQALATALHDLDFTRIDAGRFAACPADSIDYAVMEHTREAAVVPLDVFWSDVGSWSALWDAGEQDAAGNVSRGDVMLQDVTHSLAHAESRLVALLGVENLVVVETADAVLVADRSRVQEVKKIVDRLREQSRDEAVSHKQVFRPWGSYESLVSAHGFQVKRIVVNAGASLSLQLHHHRSEHWVVVSGEAEVVCGEKIFRLQHDESTYIPVGSKHRLRNPGTAPLVVIEVQTGDYLGEDDIIRFNDNYGRAEGDTPA